MSRATLYPHIFDIFTAASNTSVIIVTLTPTTSSTPASDQQRLDAIDQLLNLAPRFQHPNHGGECEDAISPAAIEEARKFLKKLPPTLPLPEVVIEPDGYLGLEWYAHRWLLYVV